MKVQKVSLKSQNVGSQLVDSFIDTGFAIVTDHGISKRIVDNVYYSARNFFGAPSHIKNLRLFDPKTMGGYFPPKTEKAKGAEHPDLKEFFHFYRHLESNEKITELYDALELYAVGMLKAIEDELLIRNIPITSSPSLSESVKGSQKTLFRLLHYPPTQDFGDDADIMERAAAHEDINLITLLPVATAPGLQVKDVQGNWHDVEADPGSIVVNVGDMLSEATKGVLPSTTHRVVADKAARSQSRYSMPLFLHPHPETVLSARHTADSYLKERLKELGLI